MKLYRAVEFSKLTFMLSAYGSMEWNKAIEDFKNNESSNANWWFEDRLKSKIEYLIADVIANGKESFFRSSMTFNSTVGGRYNPPNSFGIMYTASNPVLAALEVLYHIYDNSKKLLSHTAKTSYEFERRYNSSSPLVAKDFIVVFSINVGNDLPIEDYTDAKKLKETCARIGFHRYTDHEDYDENFIFGNNYEISRILGCYLNSSADRTAFKFKSARIQNSESTLNHYNVIFPETFIKDDDLNLTNEYYLIDTDTSVHAFQNLHDVSIRINGETTTHAKLKLEKHFDEKFISDRNRVAIYRPNIPEDLHPDLNARKVVFQRFLDSIGKK